MNGKVSVEGNGTTVKRKETGMKIALRLVIVFAVLLLIGQMNYYTRTGTIVACDNETITVRDHSGNLWEFCDGSAGFALGEEITLRMHNNGTDNTPYDDVVVGWL